MENLVHVNTLREAAMPNRLIVKFADQILKRNAAMLLPLHRDGEEGSLGWFLSKF